MKVLVTGITGFVGRHLAELWTNRDGWDITGTGRSAERPVHLHHQINYAPLNITNPDEIAGLLDKVKPTVVVHSAAMSKPNDCETDREACANINITGTQHIAEACKKRGIRLLFLSSDMVFGDNGPYTESDKTCPVNFYGESKVAAEKFIESTLQDYAIIRTVLVYGKKLPGLQNTFIHWVRDNVEAGKTIRVFTDQFRTSCFVGDLCKGIELLVSSNETGIFHICGETIFTPYQIAIEVARYLGLNEKQIEPVTHAALQEQARRPTNCTLKIDKALLNIGYTTTPLHHALALCF